MQRITNLFKCLFRAAEDTVNHDGIEHAGYLSFLGLLSLFPFLVFLTALAGAVGPNILQSDVIIDFIQVLPPNLVQAIEPRMMEIATGPSQGLLTVAILGAIWTSSSAVEGLRTILNRAYRVHTPPSYLLRRLLSIAELIVLTIIIIIGMALVLIWPVIWKYLLSVLPFDFTEITAQLSSLSYLIGVGLLFFVVSSLYYVLPNVKQRFLSVMPGAALVVALWIGAAKIITIYISQFDQVNLIYGSLGGIIAALLFFYVIGVIFIFGAEFNYMLKITTGEQIEEKEEVSAEDIPENEKDQRETEREEDQKQEQQKKADK